MRYFLLDKVISVEIGCSARGIKCVTLTDEVLHDHFPDHPILPGAMIIEGLAQLAGFLLEISVNTETSSEIRRAVLAQVEKMKLYKPCGPGDSIEYCVKVESLREDRAQVMVEAQVGGEKRAQGQLMFALVSMASENVNEQRRQIYKLWTRDLKHCLTFR